MRPLQSRHRNRATGVASLLVLGVGLTALFLGYSWFWIVFVVGFAVVVPIVSLLVNEDDAVLDEIDGMLDGLGSPSTPTHSSGDVETDDPLTTLRARYARGELTDAQFERKLETLLETETIEASEERAAQRQPRTDDSTVEFEAGRDDTR